MTDPQAAGPISAHGPEFFGFERDSAGDFPYYRDRPVALSGMQWLVVFLAVLLAFAALVAPIPFYRSTLGGFVGPILFFGIPLAALAMVAGPGWKAIFRHVGPRDVGLMFGVALLNIIVSVAVVLLVRRLFDMNANPVSGMLGSATGMEKVLFYLKTIPQLFGEEVVSVLPFLAVLWLGHRKFGLGRKGAVVLAWLSAALLFGALHLPTYGWNFVQCFLVIGTARIVLLLGYLITKNIWVSTGAHIINDWAMFTLMVVIQQAMPTT